MRDSEIPEGQHLVRLVCTHHRRPSVVAVFVRDANRRDDRWHEFPSSFPPVTFLVNDESGEAGYQFDPASRRVGERPRFSYVISCSRCDTAPVEARQETLERALDALRTGGVSRVTLDDLAASVGSTTS